MGKKLVFYWPKHRSWLRSIFRSFICLWGKLGHGNNSACSESNPVQSKHIYIDNLSQKRASAEIQIEQHGHFRWQRAKAWKRCLARSWIDWNQSLQPKWLQTKCNVWKLCIDLHWQGKHKFLVWRFLFCNLQLKLIICVTDQPTISWSRRSVLNFKFSSLFSEVDELLHEHWAKLCEVKKFHLQSMSYW